MRLAENLSKLKNQGNFNLSQLAAYTGISRATASRILSHRSSTNADYVPSYKTVRAIAESLGTTSDELYKYRMQISILE